MEDDTAVGLGDRIKALLGTVWQEREIIIRSDGRVRYVTLGRSVQLAMLLPVMAAAGGIGWMAHGLIDARADVVATTQQQVETQEAYLGLLAEVADYEKKFASISKDLESNKAYLLNVLEENTSLQERMASVQRELKSTEVDRAETVIAREALQGRVESFGGDLEDTVNQNEHLEILIDRMRSDLRVSEAHRVELVEARDLLLRRVEDFQGRVRLLNSVKADLEETVGSLQNDLSSSRAKLTGDVAAAEADADRRLAAVTARYEAQLVEQKDGMQQLLDDTRATLTAELQEARADRDRVAHLRDMLDRSLQATEAELASVFADKDRLQSTLGELHDQLVLMEQDRKAVIAERDLAADRLGVAESDLAAATSHNLLIEQQLESIETALHGALEARGEIAAENRVLEDHVAAMEKGVSDLNESHLALLELVADRTDTSVRWIEQTLARTGLDVDTLLVAAIDRPSGQGGPFEALEGNDLLPKPIEETAAHIDTQIDRWQGLVRLLTKLPLNAPVDYGRVTSGFGPRKDPVNGKTAIHAGIDIGAPLRTAVYATAAGTVTFAGWKGNFGRLVEIDHGLGIKTRYAHMHKIYVKEGQSIDFRKKIGLVGTSGRSTGSHVHYEIVVNNKALNPSKFVSAGRHVFKE